SRHGRQKTNLVDPIVEARRCVLGDDANLHDQWSHHRECQIAVGDRATKRTFPLCPFNVDMDPLIIARARRKCIDARLVDGDPIGDAQLLSDPFVQARQCQISHARSSLLSVRRHPPLHVAVLLRPLIFVASTILNLRIASSSALPPRNIPAFDTSAKPRVRLEFCESLKRSPTWVDWAECDTARSSSGRRQACCFATKAMR